jgi:hypothetical protein
MNARLKIVVNLTHSSFHLIGSFLAAGIGSAVAVCCTTGTWRISWISRNDSYLSRQ